jgi:hypothetical protein
VTRYFCTYFDSNYLAQGLTLYRSLEAVCDDFRLWVLCLDDACYAALDNEGLDKITPVPLATLIESDPQLAGARANRTLFEFYFTCTAAFTAWVLSENDQVDLLTYLDADLYFFSDPQPIYRELEDASVGIIEHRFPESLRHLERYGLYNVAWVSFRRDEQGLACLDRWRAQCIEWCYDRLEGDRFADQKYLDAWPREFQRVHSIQHKGANLAPWNVARYRLSNGGGVQVDGQALIFYHYHGLKKLAFGSLYDAGLGINRAVMTPVLREQVYRRILTALDESRQRLAAMGAPVPAPLGSRKFVNTLKSGELSRFFSNLAVIAYSLLISRCYLVHRESR